MMDFVFITSYVSQSKVLRARLRQMRLATLLIALQQLRGVLEHGVGDLAAAQHARQFGDALASFQVLDARDGPPVLLDFFHAEVVMSKARNLRQVRDAED